MAILSFWYEIVFWWAVVMTLIVGYDHANKIRALLEWLVIKFRIAQR